MQPLRSRSRLAIFSAMKRLVYIYADESCLGNARDQASPGGAAGLMEFWTGSEWERRDYWISEPATTNNRMAVRRASDGLKLLRFACRELFVDDYQDLGTS